MQIGEAYETHHPEATKAEVNNPIIALAVTLFPEPDSPTMPKTSPASMLKLKLSTALSCGQHCTPEKIAANRIRLGYDQPLIQQYLTYMKGIFVGRNYGEGAQAFTCPAPTFEPRNSCERPNQLGIAQT